MEEELKQDKNIDNNDVVSENTELAPVGEKAGELVAEDQYRDLFSQAMHLYETRNFEEASKVFLGIYDKFPDKPEALTNYGNCQYEILNVDEAVKYWKMAKEKDKYMINPYVNLGNYYLANERYEEAISEYSFAFCLNPQNEMSTVNLAITHEKMNDKKKAFMLYEFYLAGNLNVSSNTYKSIHKKVTVHKLNAISHMKLGIFFEKKGYFRKAMQSYFESVKMFPNFAKTYSNIGNIFFKLGKLDYAKLYWLEAYKIDKKNVNLYLNLAICCEKLGDLINTYAFYAKFIQHAKNSAKDIQIAQNALSNVRAQIIANPAISRKYQEEAEQFLQTNKLEDALIYYDNLSHLSSKKEITEKLNEINTSVNIVHKAAYVSFEMAKDLFEKGKFEYAMDKCKLAKSLWPDSYFDQNINNLINKCKSSLDTTINRMIKAKL